MRDAPATLRSVEAKRDEYKSPLVKASTTLKSVETERDRYKSQYELLLGEHELCESLADTRVEHALLEGRIKEKEALVQAQANEIRLQGQVDILQLQLEKQKQETAIKERLDSQGSKCLDRQ